MTLTASAAPAAVLTAAVAPLGVLTASAAAGSSVLGLLDESGSAAVLDEAGGFILNEDGT